METLFYEQIRKKFGKYAIHNLTMVLIMCYVAGYVIELMGSAAGNNLLGFLTLDPYRILHGQIWRLVTWVLVPPDSLDIFTIIMLFFYYSLGSTLERTWGTYRYNVYIFPVCCSRLPAASCAWEFFTCSPEVWQRRPHPWYFTAGPMRSAPTISTCPSFWRLPQRIRICRYC